MQVLWMSGETYSRQSHSICKDPGARMCLASSKNSKETTVTRTEWVRERGLGDEDREVGDECQVIQGLLSHRKTLVFIQSGMKVIGVSKLHFKSIIVATALRLDWRGESRAEWGIQPGGYYHRVGERRLGLGLWLCKVGWAEGAKFEIKWIRWTIELEDSAPHWALFTLFLFEAVEFSCVVELKLKFLLFAHWFIHLLLAHWSSTSLCFTFSILSFLADWSVNCPSLPLEGKVQENLALVKIVHNCVLRA